MKRTVRFWLVVGGAVVAAWRRPSWPLHLLAIPALAALGGGAALWTLAWLSRRARDFLCRNRRRPSRQAARTFSGSSSSEEKPCM